MRTHHFKLKKKSIFTQHPEQNSSTLEKKLTRCGQYPFRFDHLAIFDLIILTASILTSFEQQNSTGNSA